MRVPETNNAIEVTFMERVSNLLCDFNENGIVKAHSINSDTFPIDESFQYATTECNFNFLADFAKGFALMTIVLVRSSAPDIVAKFTCDAG
jgi:hypothetical protein